MKKTKYDVIIIGGGPAGIFTALELIKYHNSLDILLLEKGLNIEKRKCPIDSGTDKCIHCPSCSVVTGWGGAGAFSDGKFTMTTEFGGILGEYISQKSLLDLIDYVDNIYVSFGATTKVHGTDEQRVADIQKKAAAADLKLVPAIIKHLGTDKCYEVLKKMQHYLQELIEIRTRTFVEDILVEGDRVKGVRIEGGQEIYGDYVVAMPGREGAEWFYNQTSKLGLNTVNNPIDIGVRVEVPAVVLKDLTDVVYESKLIYYTKSFDDMVRTFCMNPYGQVVVENNNGLKTVNGHSFSDKKTDNTNFALLVSKEFTQPFKSPIAYGKYIATLANMLGEGVIIQRLGDLLKGRRSTPERIKKCLTIPTLRDATPGDLSLVLPYRHLQNIIEMLRALDKVAPGVYSRNTLLYGVEVKFYSARVEVDQNLETRICNLFAAGDGAGITRGLAQASVSGVVVANEILNRIG